MLEIKTYSETDKEEIITLVLHCQNDGTRHFVTVDNQPDVLHIKETYIDGGGNFWVAKEDEKLAGCIGLMKYQDGIYVLKKFFVYEPYRGEPHHLGRRLYETLLEFAQAQGARQMILDTPKNTDRAHKFYEKAGFKQVEREQLPIVYQPPYENCDYFVLSLEKSQGQ